MTDVCDFGNTPKNIVVHKQQTPVLDVLPWTAKLVLANFPAPVNSILHISASCSLENSSVRSVKVVPFSWQRFTYRPRTAPRVEVIHLSWSLKKLSFPSNTSLCVPLTGMRVSLRKSSDISPFIPSGLIRKCINHSFSTSDQMPKCNGPVFPSRTWTSDTAIGNLGFLARRGSGRMDEWHAMN